MDDAGEKYVISKNEKIVNCSLFDSFEEAYVYIKDSIFRNEIDAFEIVTFRDYVDGVKF